MRWISHRGLALAVLAWTLFGVAPLAWSQSRLETDSGETELDVEEGLRREERGQLELRRGLPSVAQEGPVDAATYVLGPGDLLHLDLWGRLLRSVALEVSPEGRVFLPGSGPIDVTGQTLAWARERIVRQVSSNFVGVKVDVRLARLRTFKVFVTGFVKTPGPVEVTSAMRASEAVRSAEPLGEGSRRNIEVRRRNGATFRLDLAHAEAAGDFTHDPFLIDGDVIQVPRSTEMIEVTGAVGRTGRVEFVPGDSLSTLLEMAGGLLPSAVTDRALIVRFRDANARESLWVSLDGLPEGRGDIPLRDGDRLFILYQAEYHVLPSVGIYGEVNQPGAYPIVLGVDRFSDLVRWAGGFRPLANRSGMLLVRESPAATERDPEFDRLVRLPRGDMTESEYAKFQTKLAERKNSFRIDWGRLERGGDDIDPLLQPGDVARVDLLVPSVRVEGEVNRPGFVDYVQGRAMREYIQLAGGFTERASRRGTRVSRSLTGQVLPARSLRAIQPGDFIWVPERKDVEAWSVFRDVVTVAGQVAVIIFTLSR